MSRSMPVRRPAQVSSLNNRRSYTFSLLDSRRSCGHSRTSGHYGSTCHSQERLVILRSGGVSRCHGAAGACLRAETDQDADAARAAGDALMQAAAAAMAVGCSLTEIARAEARGKETIRHSL